MENENSNERLGSDTRTQDLNNTTDPKERCLHPFCSPVVDGREHPVITSDEELIDFLFNTIGNSKHQTADEYGRPLPTIHQKVDQ